MAAALLDASDSTICLREPDDHVGWLAEATMIVYESTWVPARPLTNYFPARQHVDERRPLTFEMKEVDSRHLQKNFTLAMKHNVGPQTRRAMQLQLPVPQKRLWEQLDDERKQIVVEALARLIVKATQTQSNKEPMDD